jgi:hypothetical protein
MIASHQVEHRNSSKVINDLYQIEPLEGRCLLTVTINATGGADTISVEYIFDIIDHWHIVVNGSSSDRLPDGELVVNGLGGADQIEIIKAFFEFSTVSGGLGDDVITVGGGNFGVNFHATAEIRGDGGNDTLVIKDETDFPNAGLGPGTLGMEYRDFCQADESVENFILRGASGEGFFSVEVTPGTAITSIRVEGMGGNDHCDFLRLGNDTTFDFIGGTGSDDFHFFSTSGVLNDYTITSNSVIATLSEQVLANWSQTQEIEIRRQVDDNDQFTITDVSAGTSMTVNGGAGDDFYTIGGNDIDANILGTLEIVDFSDGEDTVLFSDGGGSTADQYTLDVESFTKTGLANPITFTNIETRTLNANGGDNLITIAPDPDGTRVNLAAGGGLNTLIYGAGDIRSGQTAQFIGVTNLLLQDEGPNPSGVSDKDYTLDASGMQYFVNGSLATTLLFQGLDTLNLFAGAYNSTFTINPVSTNSLHIFAGDGADNLIVNNFSPTGNLDLSGELGSDSITLNYGADTGASYIVTNDSFDKTGLGNMNAGVFWHRGIRSVREPGQQRDDRPPRHGADEPDGARR